MRQVSTMVEQLRKRRKLLDLFLVVVMASSIAGGVVFLPKGKVARAATPDATTALGKNGDGTPPLYPHQYDIQYHPKIYLDFWGAKWDNNTGVIKQVAATFEALAGTPYNHILSQYGDGAGDYIHNDVQLMGTWIDDASSSLPSYIDITNEVGVEEKSAVKHFGLPYGNMSAMHDVQVIVFPQNGTSYVDGGGFCGQHYFDTTSGAAYGLIQYSNSSCNPTGDAGQNMAWYAVHEYAEAATDRQIYWGGTSFDGHGWHTNDTSYQFTPNEVADLCQGWNPSNSYAADDLYSAPKGVFFTVPYLWSNYANGCVITSGWSAANACPASLSQGDSGTWVNVLQRTLNAYKYNYGFSTSSPQSWTYPLQIDGQFGPQTEAAVVDFQYSRWANLDSSGGGVVGDRTWSLLGFCESYTPPAFTPILTDDTGNISLTNCPAGLGLGDSGIWVEALQMRLNQAFYYGMFADSPDDFEVGQTFLGIHPQYDSLTDYAVADFQQTAKNTTISGGGGGVGNRTWSNLGMCWG